MLVVVTARVREIVVGIYPSEWFANELPKTRVINSTASVSRAQPGLALVSLEVAGEGTVARDVAAALFVPPDSDATRRAFVAVVGDLRFAGGAGNPQAHEVTVAEHAGQWAEFDLGASPSGAVVVLLAFDELDAATGASVEGALLVAVNSLGWLPYAATSTLRETSRWCLVVAIAALGTKTSLGELARVGWRPVAIIVGETVFVALFVLGGLSLI